MANREKQGGSYDETTGRLRKAWGELTGDEEQKRKGSVEKGEGKLKDTIDRGADAVKGMFDKNRQR